MGRSTDKVGGYCGRGSSCRCCWQCCPPPCPIQLLRPPTLTSLPQLPPTSPPPLSRPTTLLSQSSRTSLPLEPRLSLDPSVPTRLFTSQLSTRPALTPSRLSPRLLPPLSTLLLRSQLLLPMLLQLLLLGFPYWQHLDAPEQFQDHKHQFQVSFSCEGLNLTFSFSFKSCLHTFNSLGEVLLSRGKLLILLSISCLTWVSSSSALSTLFSSCSRAPSASESAASSSIFSASRRLRILSISWIDLPPSLIWSM